MPSDTSRTVYSAIAIVVLAIFAAGSTGGSSSSSSSSGSGSSAPVTNSAWDGGVSQVKRYIEKNAKDPKSVEYIEWSPVTKQGSGYLVRVKYRAKNSFGGYVIEEAIFVLDASGGVVSMVPKGQ